jgi:hypothetical protein
MKNNILTDIEELVLEMQSPNVFFSHETGQVQSEQDPRDYSEIEDLYEFIDKVNADNTLTFVQKNQMIEGKMKNKK